MAMSREAFAELARSNTMDLVKNMGEDLKNELRETLATNLEQGLGMRDAANSMVENIEGMSKGRASTIARTETTRAKNLGNAYKYQDKGYQSFTVSFTGEACDMCVDFYQNMVFSIDDIDSLPPLHPNCMCVAVFHPETPEEYADKYGYDVYDSGDSEASPDETDNENTSNDETNSNDDSGIQDIMDTLSSVPTEDLQTLVSSIAPDVTGGATNELADADLAESLEEYIKDPDSFAQKYPKRADTVSELLSTMLKNQKSNLGGV